jgi:hypothetical protein
MSTYTSIQEDLFRSWPLTKVTYLPLLKQYGYSKSDLGFEFTQEEQQWFWAFFEVAKKKKLQIGSGLTFHQFSGYVYTIRRTAMKTYYISLEKI